MFCWKKFHQISKHDKFQSDLAKRHYENQLTNKVRNNQQNKDILRVFESYLFLDT